MSPWQAVRTRSTSPSCRRSTSWRRRSTTRARPRKGFLAEGSEFDFDRIDSKRLESYAQAKRYLDRLIPRAQELVETWEAKSWLRTQLG